MRRLAALATAILVSIAGAQAPATASEPPVEVLTIELAGEPETRFEIGGRRYAGPVVFTEHSDGIAFTESASIEQYLEGIAEMPFLWHSEALAAQAVAARTYLARRLLGGRKGDAARYEYDICATTRCQVYKGVELVEGDHGGRWAEAVESTAGEVLLYAGKPIEAVYTSSVGSRSRANQDVWASSEVPYLQPVDSPEPGNAPYAEWTVVVTGAQFVAILEADGYDVGGDLESIAVDDPPEGDGRTTLTLTSSEGDDSLLAPNLKGAFNRRGDDLFPGLLPARTEDGKLLPQPLLSYTFEITHEHVDPRPADFLLPQEDRGAKDAVTIDGEGWGHGVGMSQWGAQIMAKDGSGYADILSHYYTGTEPQAAPTLVPENVIVGLDWGEWTIPVTVDGTAVVKVNGVPFQEIASGEWVVRSTSFGIDIVPAGAPWLDSLLGQRHWPQ